MNHRTAIITAASVAVVIAAATAAIATNLGILDGATASSDVGTLSLETVVTSPGPGATETPPAAVVLVDDTAESVTDQEPGTEAAGEVTAYAVGDAGIVTLSNDGTMLTVLDVVANPGWETAQILDGTSVDVGFVGADGGSLQFTAELDDAGAIIAAVNDLAAGDVLVITETVYEDGTPAGDVSSGTYDDDDDEYESDDDKYESDDDKYESDDDKYESDDDGHESDDKYEDDDDD